MLTLLLLRHAKAVPQGGDDFSRALTDRGIADAKALGAFLRKEKLVPALALVSPSSRTRQTLEGIETTAGTSIETRHEPALYNATAPQLREWLTTVDSAVKTLMMVGHNPGIVDLATLLAETGDSADFRAMSARFPPCSLVVITFDREEWADAGQGGRLILFLTPDQLPRD